MKKKKLYLTAFLLVLALALQGGIFSGFSVPVQAAATSKKQTGFVKHGYGRLAFHSRHDPQLSCDADTE